MNFLFDIFSSFSIKTIRRNQGLLIELQRQKECQRFQCGSVWFASIEETPDFYNFQHHSSERAFSLLVTRSCVQVFPQLMALRKIVDLLCTILWTFCKSENFWMWEKNLLHYDWNYSEEILAYKAAQ